MSTEKQDSIETDGKSPHSRDLLASEQRFRTMAEGTDILISISDYTSHATYFNNAWSQFTGRTMEELVDAGWMDLIHPRDRQQFVDRYLRAFQKQEDWAGEMQMLNSEGQYRWLLAKGSVLRLDDGSFAGFISSGVDITARKEAEQQLQESNQQIRSLVDSAPFPIGVYVGRDMRITLANRSILDIWGKGYDVIGKTYREVLPELHNQAIFEQLDQVYRTGIPFHAESQVVQLIVNQRSVRYYFNYSFTPLFDGSGQVYGVMNTAADVSALGLAQQQLQKSEANLRQIILQAPVAMCILMGPSHIVDVANEFMVRLWGKSRAEVMNKPIFEGLPDAKEQGLEALLDQVFTTGESVRATERPVVLLRQGKQEMVYQNFVYQPYKDSEGTILGVLAISVDVTKQVLARHQIEEVVAERTQELAMANQQLQKSNAELAQFAYIASHDLQEPLRKISTYSELLDATLQGKLDETSARYLQKIREASLRMHTLIRDVLSYSQLLKETEVFTPVDLNEILAGALIDHELMIEQKQAVVRVGKLPVIEAIPLQMSQLFGNLTGNALKFARKDRTPLIGVSALKIDVNEKERLGLDITREYFCIRFKDNGIGFKAEYAEKIFDIFQRLHNTSEYTGTGIGLAMCKKIALNHGGSIDALQSSEAGAVFTVVLPALQH